MRGGSYKAVLLRHGEFGGYAGLAIFNGPFDKTPTVFAPQTTTAGSSWGNVPWLEFDESGALLLYNQNIAFGRNKWQQVLTVLEKDASILSENSPSTPMIPLMKPTILTARWILSNTA